MRKASCDTASGFSETRSSEIRLANHALSWSLHIKDGSDFEDVYLHIEDNASYVWHGC